MKIGISTYHLHQIFDHLISIIRYQQAKAKVEITACIKTGSGWSKKVEIWKYENKLTNGYNCIRIDEENGVWNVSPHDGIVYSHSVRITSEFGSLFPMYDCKIFTSQLIPCRGICAVVFRIEDPLFSVSNLHPRWWISNHPEYPSCLEDLVFTNTRIGTDCGTATGPAVNLYLQLLQQIRVPMGLFAAISSARFALPTSDRARSIFSIPDGEKHLILIFDLTLPSEKYSKAERGLKLRLVLHWRTPWPLSSQRCAKTLSYAVHRQNPFSTWRNIQSQTS